MYVCGYLRGSHQSWGFFFNHAPDRVSLNLKLPSGRLSASLRDVSITASPALGYRCALSHLAFIEVLGIKLSSSGLHDNTFTERVMSSAIN